MKLVTLCTVVALMAVSVGCKKDETSKTTTTGSSASAVTTTAAGGGATGCGPDAVKSDKGGFCFKGKGMTGSDPFDKDSHTKTHNYDGIGTGITINVTAMEEASDWDDEVKERDTEGKGKSNKNLKTEDLPGGGKFWSWDSDDKAQWVTVLTHKDKTLFFCRTYGRPAADAANVEACRSLRPL